MRTATVTALTVLMIFYTFPSASALAQASPEMLSDAQKHSLEATAFLIANYKTLLENRDILHKAAPNLYSSPKELEEVLPSIDILLALPDANILVEVPENQTCASIWHKNSSGKWQDVLRSQNPDLYELPPQTEQSNVFVCITESSIMGLGIVLTKQYDDPKPKIILVITEGFLSKPLLRMVGGVIPTKGFLSDWQSGTTLSAGSRSLAELDGRFIVMAREVRRINFLTNVEVLEKLYGCTTNNQNKISDKECAEVLWKHESDGVKVMWQVSRSLSIPFFENSRDTKIQVGYFLPELLNTLVNYSKTEKGIRNFVLDQLKRRYPELTPRFKKFWKKMK